MSTDYLTMETTQLAGGAVSTSILATAPGKESDRFFLADTRDWRRDVAPEDEVRNAVRFQTLLMCGDDTATITLCMTADEAFNLAARLVTAARQVVA